MIINLKRHALSLILLVAGIAHFMVPNLFLVAMPPYIPWHKELIFLTGVLEVIFAVGLTIDKTRYLASVLTACYFIAILPAHIHVSVNGIEMFGISSPILLWMRTFFQSVFIYWAWSLRHDSRKS